MSYRLKQKDYEEFFKNNSRGQNFLFPKEKGFQETFRETINDKIFLVGHTLRSNDNIEIFYDDIQNDDLKDYFYIILITNGKVKSNSSKQSFIYESLKTIIHKNANNPVRSMEFQANTNFRAIGIAVHNSILEDLKINLTNTNKEILKHSTTKPKLNNLAKNILNLSNLTAIERLNLQSMTLEIVYDELTSLIQKPKKYDVLFLKYDIEALHLAKELLENSFEPLSITQLSKKVHLNEFKLKVGFKRYFGLTPYQISINSRLEKAKTLLQDKELNIAEISQQIGFKHQQSFSYAFMRHFGICPKDVRKTAKNLP